MSRGDLPPPLDRASAPLLLSEAEGSRGVADIEDEPSRRSLPAAAAPIERDSVRAMERSREQVHERVAAVRARIAEVCSAAGRDPRAVTLVAVGKTVEAEAIAWVVEAGVADVGENYVQELRARHRLVAGARWHFIGTLQASSAHHVSALADVVETAIPGRAVERLARRAADAGRRLDALIEVDFTGERAGVAPDDVVAAADALSALEGLALRGLMPVAPLTPDREGARPWFRRLRELGERVRERHPDASELSMGMSSDYEVALGEGATMVRLGTALFGTRPAR
jgi:PLP dependent protein